MTGSALGVLSRTSGSYNLIIFYELALSLVICPFPTVLFSWGAPSIITFLTKVCCFRICSRLLCSTPSSLSRPRSHWGISTKKPKSQMNEMVTLIPTCIVSSKNYSRMILLNSEKQCIYMHRGRRRRMKRKRAEGRGGGGLIGCNYDYHRNLPYFPYHFTIQLAFFPYLQYLFTIQLTFPSYFSYLFTIQLGFLSYFPYLFTIELTFLPYCPSLITIKLTFLLYFPNLFTIQLAFLPYFPYLFTIQLTFLPYFPNHFTIQLAFLPYFPNLFTIQLTFLP